MYLRLRYRNISADEAKSDIASLKKLYYIARINNALDRLEAKGFIDVLNDHDNEWILVKLNDSYRKK